MFARRPPAETTSRARRRSRTRRRRTTSDPTSSRSRCPTGARSRLPAKVAISGQRGQRSAGGGRRQRGRGQRAAGARRRRRCSPTTSPGPANEADQALAVTAVTAGPDTHGTVTLDRPERSRTSPTAGFAGTATFTYTVCDDGTTAGHAGSALCADGVVTVTVAPAPNEPPVADPATVEAVEDTPLVDHADRQRPRRRPLAVRRGRRRRRTGRYRAPRPI